MMIVITAFEEISVIDDVFWIFSESAAVVSGNLFQKN